MTRYLASFLLVGWIGAASRTDAPVHSRLTDLLRGIRHVESRGDSRAVSPLGASWGRGAYMVSDIALQDAKRHHPDSAWWQSLTPADMHEDWKAQIVAHDILRRLMTWSGGDESVALTAYWRGPSDTMRFGVAMGYVREVQEAAQ